MSEYREEKRKERENGKNEAANSSKANNSKSLGTKATFSPFPITAIDTSWMTKTQKKFFEVLQQSENQDKKYDVLSKLAGFKSSILGIQPSKMKSSLNF